ncbi:hypothetical protein [Mucilaginibacter flavidus]|uniref:hypothetical protein n=1 Tax=Mucilaginibacter flavidus TaxID=2949309 RepID=UPI0020922D40|nr:hypothetical protein [Mucilaginibacter flavidus]MCO5948011.1 hypothetical protein [Mucilaginibacter flavidus]
MSTANKNWEQLEDFVDQDLSILIDNAVIPKMRSQNPLIKIRRNLLINLILGVLICCFYLILLFDLTYWEVRGCLALVMLFSLWALITAFIRYQNLNIAVLADRSLLAELKSQREKIINWMKSQARVALFVYPVSAAGGFMLGGAIGSGKPVAGFMSKPLIWLIFVVVVAILVPLCHHLTKWMYRQSFGKHLDDLQRFISELENEK